MERELAYPAILKDGLRPITRDEFDAIIYQSGSLDKSLVETYLEDAADAYDESHPVFKVLKNFVPVLGIATDLLEAYKAQKDRWAGEKLHEVVYQLVNAYIELNLKVLNHRVGLDQIKQQLPALFNAYIDYSMEAYQLEKIEYFKNVFVNGVVDYNRLLDEKINIFNIIASLTVGEIEILIYNDRRQIGKFGTSMSINELSNAIKSPDTAYLEQMCDNLAGKGLLVKDLATGFDGGGKTIGYHKADYIDRLVKYICLDNTISDIP